MEQERESADAARECCRQPEGYETPRFAMTRRDAVRYHLGVGNAVKTGMGGVYA